MTTYTWNGGSGDWNVADNWSPSTGYPNGYGDEALITAGGTYTVTLSNASYIVGVLQMAAGATLSLQSATLSVYPTNGLDASDLSGTISVDGSSTLNFEEAWTTAQLGAIDAASGATLDFAGTLDNTGATFVVGAGVLLKGAIEAGTIEGAIVLEANQSLTLEGGTTLTGAGGSGDGLIEDTGASSTLRLENTQTLANTTIDLGDATNYSYLNQADTIGGDQVLTLASSTTIDVAGFAYITGSSDAGDGIVNQGAIDVTATGAYLTISDTTFTNDGTIDVANDSYLTFQNGSGIDFINNGTITVDGTSTVTFDGLTTAQLGTVDAASGATLDFGGTGLDNSGATYDVVSGVALEGEISGGTIDGALILNAYQTLGLADSPIVTGPFGTGDGFIDDANYQSTLDLDSTQTIDNVTILLATSYISQVNPNTVTTLGPGVTIDILGNAIIDGSQTGAGIINQGVIDDSLNEADPSFYGISFTNEGKMNFSNHEGVVVDNSVAFTNAATGTIEASVGANGNAYILFQDSIVNDGTITVDGSAGPTQQAYVDYYYSVTGSGTTDIANGALADFFQSQMQRVTFTGGGGTLQDNSNTNTGAVIGFTTGDTINLTGLLYDDGAVSWSIDYADNVLTVKNASQSATVQLDPDANYAGYAFQLADDYSDLPGGDGTYVTDTPCYCRGTQIAVAGGEIAVERLAIGDRVVTASGAHRPIQWIGHRELDTTRHPLPWSVWPVRVRAHAFGENLPRRALWLSPEHAVFVEEKLIPIGQLVNGGTIAQTPVDRVSYWHIELETHDVLLAEGLPAESYLDCGNRAAFENAGDGVVALHPDWRPLAQRRDFAAPRVVARMRKQLAARAEGLGLAAEVEAYEIARRARLRVERTNFVRNPRGEGCRVGPIGAGGEAPWHWWLDAPAGIAIAVAGAGEEDGLPFVDLRFRGKAAAPGNCCVHPEPGPAVAARRGQYWTVSSHIRLIDGTLDGAEAVNLFIDEMGADGAYLTGAPYAQAWPSRDDLGLQRASATRRLERPDAAAMTAYLQIPVAAGAAIDFTLRVAGLQIEKGRYASDLILPPPGQPKVAHRRSSAATAMNRAA